MLSLLVVFVILAVLLSMLAVWVQNAREEARRQQCQNNLKQLAIGCLSHEQMEKWFPSDGWGYAWTGDAEMGFAAKQPGGWIYNVGPFVESQSWHDLGAGLTNPTAKNAENLRRVNDVLLSYCYCTTRRRSFALPWKNPWGVVNAGTPKMVGRTDYAANGGDCYTSPGAPTAPLWASASPGIEAGPASLAEGGSGGSKGQDRRARKTFASIAHAATGVIFCGSAVRMADITDGAENTYLLGEKTIDPDYYATGEDLGDRFAALLGDCPDIARWTFLPPLADTPGYVGPSSFGAAHPAGFNMAFCDGHVTLRSYSIDPETHRRLGNRKDK